MTKIDLAGKKAVDLFCGAGGFSTGATMAGLDVVWACDFDAEALSWHRANHPGCGHALRDLAPLGREPPPDLFDDVPDFDVLLASPCCQGHSKGLGGKKLPHHKASRATAWAPVVLAEARRPNAVIVENVEGFLSWKHFPMWLSRMENAGYGVFPSVIDSADCGVPQNRPRLLIVCLLGQKPVVDIGKPDEHVAIGSVIDWSDKAKWSPVDKPGRSKKTMSRIENGKKSFGDRFVFPYYSSGSGLTGRTPSRPVGVITTKDRWGVANGDMMRMFTVAEYVAAMGFPEKYLLPKRKDKAVKVLGNAVCPPAIARVLDSIFA